MILGADLVIVWVITKQSAVYNFLTTVKIYIFICIQDLYIS